MRDFRSFMTQVLKSADSISNSDSVVEVCIRLFRRSESKYNRGEDLETHCEESNMADIPELVLTFHPTIHCNPNRKLKLLMLV